LRPDYALTFERQPSGDVVSLVNLQAMTTSTLSEAGGSAAIDNANVGGVKNRAGRIVGDCENVRTGIEVSIPLAWLGIPAGAGGEVRLLALTTSTAATPFVSGQFLPGMPLGAFEVGSSPRPFDFRSRSYARFALTPTPPSTGWMIQ
ncbi:hypothetical protein HZA57_00255, partial [Candidatus Poribacteria bacterium]|nr:hypothetical protein [Candidatus Poribacteria bacterium]